MAGPVFFAMKETRRNQQQLEAGISGTRSLSHRADEPDRGGPDRKAAGASRFREPDI